MDTDTVGKLEEAFLWGCTDIEACVYADIHRDTLYAYITKHPEFSDRKETLKTSPTMKAKRIISNDLDDNDSATAHKVLDRAIGKKLTIEGGNQPLKVDAPWLVQPLKAQTSER